MMSVVVVVVVAAVLILVLALCVVLVLLLLTTLSKPDSDTGHNMSSCFIPAAWLWRRSSTGMRFLDCGY